MGSMKVWLWSGFMALLLMACQGQRPERSATGPSLDTATDVLAGNGVKRGQPGPVDTTYPTLPHLPRTDGYYDQQATPGLHYLMRFFPQGQVALVAGGVGPEGVAPLAQRLRPALPGSTDQAHLVPYLLHGDSIFFTTSNKKGSIGYAGIVSSTDTLCFLKTSAITGKQAVVTFVFRPELPLQ